ncbi:hypothetical protein ACRAWD_21905 [Caulobacter segnis]
MSGTEPDECELGSGQAAAPRQRGIQFFGRVDVTAGTSRPCPVRWKSATSIQPRRAASDVVEPAALPAANGSHRLGRAGGWRASSPRAEKKVALI